jgi:hypothetical protein
VRLAFVLLHRDAELLGSLEHDGFERLILEHRIEVIQPQRKVQGRLIGDRVASYVEEVHEPARRRWELAVNGGRDSQESDDEKGCCEDSADELVHLYLLFGV